MIKINNSLFSFEFSKGFILDENWIKVEFLFIFVYDFVNVSFIFMCFCYIILILLDLYLKVMNFLKLYGILNRWIFVVRKLLVLEWVMVVFLVRMVYWWE